MKALTTSEFNEMFLNATDKLNIGFRTTFGGDALVAYKNGYMRLGWPNYVVELEDGHQHIENRNYHNLSLTHYIDCPKCQKDTTSNDSLL